ncbi:MFS transporter [Streptomyces sp. YS-3]|uniref:MFS transporter n=1 Tax=Streptomyces sp. YS-3 TaxID=3381352 RepID=UPI00386279D0
MTTTARTTSPTGPTKSTRKPSAVAVLALGHATVDFYQGAVPALVPFLVAGRGYGYTAVSGIVLAATLLSSVVQPLFGALTDRRTMPWLIPLSSLCAGVGLALAGLGHSYALTWLAVALAGTGVAAYHPESARLARAAGRGSHVAMGWYSLGGTLGFALAPLVVGPVLTAGGLGATPWLVVPAVAGVLCTAPAVLVLARRAAPGRAGATSPAAPDDWPVFLRLSAIVVCRSVVFVGLSAFIGLYAQERVGGGPATGSAALFTLFAGGAAGTVAGGRLAARRGRVRTVRTAYAASVPAVAGVVLVPGPAFFVFVALAAAVLYVPFSLQVTLGQDFLPSRVGTASGVTLGLAVSVGGVTAPGIGALGETAGLGAALAPLIALCALAWWLARTLPEPKGMPGYGPGTGSAHGTPSGG